MPQTKLLEVILSVSVKTLFKNVLVWKYITKSKRSINYISEFSFKFTLFCSYLVWHQWFFMKNTKIISVTWQSLSAYVKDKPILNDCSGYCKPGEMLAIMGPSGAGKTTLLSLISKRHSSSLAVTGEVFTIWLRRLRIMKDLMIRPSIGLELLFIRMIYSSKVSQSEVTFLLVRNTTFCCPFENSKQVGCSWKSWRTYHLILASKMCLNLCWRNIGERDIRWREETPLCFYLDGFWPFSYHFRWANFRIRQQ